MAILGTFSEPDILIGQVKIDIMPPEVVIDPAHEQRRLAEKFPLPTAEILADEQFRNVPVVQDVKAPDFSPGLLTSGFVQEITIESQEASKQENEFKLDTVLLAVGVIGIAFALFK